MLWHSQLDKILRSHCNVFLLFFMFLQPTQLGFNFLEQFMLLFWMWLFYVYKAFIFFLACLPEQTTSQIFTDAWRFKEFTSKSMTSTSILDTGTEEFWCTANCFSNEKSSCICILKFINQNNVEMVMQLSSAEFAIRFF